MQCLDAETLATWADGGLSKAQADEVELHVSSCDRCTAMLATFVRTAPEPAVVESVWRRWQLRWLVPIATATTVAALWVLIPRDRTPASNAPDTFAMAQPSPQPAPPVAEEKDLQALRGAADRLPASAAPRALEAAPPQLPRARADAPVERREAAEGFAPTVPSPSAPPPATAPAVMAPPVTPEREQRAGAGGTAAIGAIAGRPVPPTAVGAPAERPAPQASAAASAAPDSTAAARAAADSAAADRGARAKAPEASSPLIQSPQALARQAAAPAQLEVVSPDPMRRWRIAGTGVVERTTNGGAQWQRATLPESATLTGGSSPSPSICWLVGRAGAIYVTTDGLRFVRVAFPYRTDFVSIRATDDRRATVITIDGRTLQTEDQGATWAMP